MEIKTKDQFYSLADNWYQRTIRLAEIWQSKEDIPENKRVKAVYLWSIMAARMAKITQKAIEISSPKKPSNFKSSGVVGRVKRDYHMSDCATNNAPALPIGPCDCGLE